MNSDADPAVWCLCLNLSHRRRESVSCEEYGYVIKKFLKRLKQFDEVERAGTEIRYRCIDCRWCQKCKKKICN